jgi:PhnB protein
MKVQAYLAFDGRCDEALEYYRQTLGAELTMMLRFKDAPMPLDPKMVPPGNEGKVMHMQFRIGETTLLASDGRCTGATKFQGFSLALYATDEAEAKQKFNALADGGQVHMPLDKTFFSPCFGIVVDRFGVSWMVIVEK